MGRAALLLIATILSVRAAETPSDGWRSSLRPVGEPLGADGLEGALAHGLRYRRSRADGALAFTFGLRAPAVAAALSGAEADGDDDELALTAGILRSWARPGGVLSAGLGIQAIDDLPAPALPAPDGWSATVYVEGGLHRPVGDRAHVGAELRLAADDGSVFEAPSELQVGLGFGLHW